MNTETPIQPPPPLDLPLPETPDFRQLFEALLRRPRDLVVWLANPDHRAAFRFSLLALVSFLLFGVVIGCFAKHEQLWAAPLKISAGVLIAGVICFPSLYIFSTLAGGKTSVQQLAACFAGALALAGLLVLGFAPAIWIFAESTDSYGFVGTLGIGAWLIALAFGLRFLKTAVQEAGGRVKGPMVIWSFIFILVSLQMTTSLRPILGTSPKLLTQEKKFFLQHWGDWFTKSQNPTALETTGTSTESLKRGDARKPSPEGKANPYLER